jgi:hypothetical protein
MTPEDIQVGLWLFVALIAVWIIARMRLRSREAMRSYRPAHRGIAHRMAGRKPPVEIAEEEEEEAPWMTPADWARNRRQFLLTFAALVLIVGLAVVSCLRGGL